MEHNQVEKLFDESGRVVRVARLSGASYRTGQRWGR